MTLSDSDTKPTTWGTQPGTGHTEEYDPGRFYIRATNRHNHHTTVAMGKTMAEQVDVERINLPPRTSQSDSRAGERPDTPLSQQPGLHP